MILDLWCQLASFSAKPTPLPFTVWQMMAVGRSCASGRRRNTLRSASTSWPSTSIGREIESAPLVGERLEILNLVRGPGRLHLVVVDHGGQVGQAVLARAHRGFPYRAFVDLAVAHHHDHAAVALLHANGERHADTDRKAVAERAGRGLNAGHFAGFRMAAKDRVAAAERVERVDGKKALVGQHDIERDAAVPLAQDHAVAVMPRRLCGPIAQDVVVEHAHDLDQRHRRADMASLAAFKRAHHQLAQIFRPLIERRRSGLDKFYGLGAGSHLRVLHFARQSGEKVGCKRELRRLRVRPSFRSRRRARAAASVRE